jgi:D-inositol-3-phosphate glycosyltransferase
MTQSQLKIAMLSAHSCPVGDLGAKDTGGMSVYIRELAGELSKQGNSVDVYTRIHDPKDPVLVELGEQARLIHLKAGTEARINKMDVYFSLPEFIFNLESYWKNNGCRYDIVFGHYWLSGLVGEHLQQKWQIPLVMMYHTLGAVKNAVGIGENEPDLRIASEGDSIRECQRILVPTEREKQNIIKYYGALPNKIGITPCGVNLELFQPVDRIAAREKLGVSDKKILLFVGRIDPLKGLDQLLRALTYLKSFKGLRLVIIGGDEYSRTELEKLIKLSDELEIQDSVTFLGMVKHDQLPYYYSAADVCIVPSYYESFGLVALEALACGTPIVATDVGDLRNIIRQDETGHVVADNDPEKLAAGIARFLSRPNRDGESILINRASVSKSSWTHIADLVIKELHQVLDGQGFKNPPHSY